MLMGTLSKHKKIEMKNPFQSFGFKKTKKTVKTPWQKDGDGALDPKEKFIGHNPKNFNCPQCDYPLISAPSAASPCPNCGFVGHYTTFDEKNTGNTVNISKIVLPEKSAETEAAGHEAESITFKLMTDSSEEILIERVGDEVILNRALIDPGNSTISRERHALIKRVNEQFVIRDLSTNRSTFFQAMRKTQLKDNCRLVLGNILFKYSERGQQSQQPEDGKTKMLGQFDLAPSASNSTLTLIEESGGKTHIFKDHSVVVNNALLDMENTAKVAEIHALFEYSEGKWHVSDKTASGATSIIPPSSAPFAAHQYLYLSRIP